MISNTSKFVYRSLRNRLTMLCNLRVLARDDAQLSRMMKKYYFVHCQEWRRLVEAHLRVEGGGVPSKRKIRLGKRRAGVKLEIFIRLSHIQISEQTFQ